MSQPSIQNTAPSRAGILRRVPICFWMVLVALLIRWAVIPFVYDEWMQPYFVSHWEQGNVARGLLSGRGFSSPFPSLQSSAIMPPVYPLVVAAIFALFGVHTLASVLATLGLNALLSSLACIPVYLMARRSFGERVALWAGWAWSFSPYGIYFSAEWAWSTQVLLLSLCWLLYLSQDLERSSSLKLWAGFALLTGFATLTEPVVLTIAPWLVVISAVRLARAGKSWLLPAVLAAVVLTATLMPWIARNYVVFHRFIPMRDSMGLELKLGNDGYSRHWIHADTHPNHDAAELAEYNQGELAYMEHKKQQAVSYISGHPRWYAWMCARRFVYLWTGYWSFDSSYLKEEPLDPPNVFVCTTITLLAFAGLWLARKPYPWEALRYGTVLVFFPAMYYFTHPQAYHMRPVDPVLALLACYAICRFFKPRAARVSAH